MRPVDVYNRLLECYTRLRTVTLQSGMEVLDLRLQPLTSSNGAPSPVEPTEVYNVAVLLVSELAHRHQFLD